MVDSAVANGCDPVNPNAAIGHHNQGQSCIQANCHSAAAPGAGAPIYSYGGTLWRDAAGTQPFPGATIVITVNGTEHKLKTDSLGNFSIDPATLPPLNGSQGLSKASACPSAPRLGHGTGGATGPLVQGNESCNSCHTVGGAAQPINLQ